MDNEDHFFENFSDIKSFIENLKEFDKIDLSKKSSNEINDLFFRHIPFIPQTWFGQYIERFNKHTFYRVRKNIKENEEAINLISTYSYPSSKLCKSNGRANLKGKSIFYCSDNATTSIMERQLKVGDVGYLSVWKANAKREIRFQYCLPRHLRHDNKWNEIRLDIHPLIDNYVKENYKAKGDFFIVLINYLFQKFVTEKAPYSLSSWLADRYLYGEEWIDILLYPSVAGGKKDCNMAIHPNTIEENIDFQKVIKFKVLEVRSDRIQYRPLSVGEVVNQNMKWRKIKESEKDFSKYE